jgi:RNA polymerase sigma-70 factor (ECF subfamily)
VAESPFDDLEAHVGTVFRYAMRLTGCVDFAEDVTQETFLRAWRNRGKLRERQAARLWLLRIASNVWTDYLRRAKCRPLALPAEAACPRASPCTQNDQQEQVSQAMAALDELPPRQRQVLYLATCEGLSHGEVAEVLGIGTAAVKSNLSLARKEMRRRLKGLYDDLYSGRIK